MAQTPQWIFREMAKGEMNADPVHGEFFTTEAIDSFSAALVREFIQNALDARFGVQPVKVRFIFGEGDRDIAGTYLDSLWGHLQARDSGVRRQSLPGPEEPLRFIAIEDFGTRGLTGDPTHDDEDVGSSSGGRNDFYYFWRNLGRSGKGEAERGRWGLGHTVFAASSLLNSFLGLTVRSDDGRALLMGQSVLKIHRIDGRKYCPYGWFGHPGEESFVLPIESADKISQFRKEFMLGRDGDSGLSVVIPFPETSISAESIACAVISHYFYPILHSDLAVEINANGVSETLTKETLRDRAKVLFAGGQEQQLSNLLKAFELVEWSLGLKPEDSICADPLPPGAPQWAYVNFPNEALASLQQAYEDRKPIAVRLALPVQEDRTECQTAQFSVLMERDPDAARGELYFVRQGISIVNQGAPRERSVRAVVVIDDGPLSKLLGDAENPAHTEWQERSEKFRNKYKNGASCLRFVKNSIRGIVQILTKASKERDKELLKDLFFITQPADGAEGGDDGDASKKGNKPRRPVKPAVTGQKRYVKLDRVAGGFRVFPHPDAPPGKRFIDIRLGYVVRKGNPFKRYVPSDFLLESHQFEFEVRDATVTRKKNRLTIETESKDFSVKVTGFDQHRDLAIRLNHTEAESDS